MKDFAVWGLSVVLVLIGFSLIGIMVLSQTDEAYTELYFVPNQTNDSEFVFVISNQEGETKDYSCTVYADHLAILEKEVTLEDGEVRDFFYQVQGNVSQIKVELVDDEQTIYYWTNKTTNTLQ